MGKVIDLVNQQFGRLTAIRQNGKNYRNNVLWLCQCSCGQNIVISSDSLKSGHTRSCGCLRKEISARKMITHGHNKNGKISKSYKVWNNMITRCTNSNYSEYHNYGGRGITVCQRWKKFENFLEDMGEVPKGLQLDRIDNDKGYYKENCRWVTAKVNNRNRRNNHLETFNGKTQCLAAWAEQLGIKWKTLQKRLSSGWSVERALVTPVCNGKVRDEERFGAT